MLCLSVDTTAKTASVCVSEYRGDVLLPLCESCVNGTLTHSETLLPMIDKCLSECGKKVTDIDIFAISAGPGSFTGVRIGVAAIKGLSFAVDRPHICFPVSSLEALAENLCAPLAKNVVICPVMDARRGQVYNALFRVSSGRLKRLCEDRLITASCLYDELCERYPKSRVILVGDGAFVADKQFCENGKGTFTYEIACGGMLYQHASSVAKVAFDHMSLWHNDSAFEKYSGKTLSPVYLRASQAERELAEKNSNV